MPRLPKKEPETITSTASDVALLKPQWPAQAPWKSYNWWNAITFQGLVKIYSLCRRGTWHDLGLAVKSGEGSLEERRVIDYLVCCKESALEFYHVHIYSSIGRGSATRCVPDVQQLYRFFFTDAQDSSPGNMPVGGCSLRHIYAYACRPRIAHPWTYVWMTRAKYMSIPITEIGL
jgi:hypothetical protein